MPPRQRRGVRRKKKEDTGENEDSCDPEESPSSSQNLVKSNVEKEEKDVILTVERLSKVKQNTLPDDSVQIKSSPTSSSPLRRSRRSLKESNDYVEISCKNTETEESMEIDDQNKSKVNVECTKENTKKTGEKESLGKTEFMEIDDEIQVVEGNSTSLNSKNKEFSEIKAAKKIRECKVKLVSLGDIVGLKKSEMVEPSSSDVSKLDIEESKLEVGLLKESLDLKDEKISFVISSNLGNEVKNEIVNTKSDEVFKIHNEAENLNKCTSTDTFCKIPYNSISVLPSDNQEGSTNTDMVSTEKMKEVVKENRSSLNESSNSIKSCEESNTSTAGKLVISDEISSELCDETESSALCSSIPSKNNLSSNKESIKKDELLKNINSYSSTDIAKDEIPQKGTSSNLTAKFLEGKKPCSKNENVKVSEIQIVTLEEENVKEMDLADMINEEKPTRISLNLENVTNIKMESSVKSVIASGTIRIAEIKLDSDIIDGKVTDIEAKTIKNREKESENCEIYKETKLEIKPVKESHVEIKTKCQTKVDKCKISAAASKIGVDETEANQLVKSTATLETDTYEIVKLVRNSKIEENKKAEVAVASKTEDQMAKVDTTSKIDVNKNAECVGISETEADQVIKPSTILITKVDNEPVVNSITKVDNSEPAAASITKVDNAELAAISKIEAADQITGFPTSSKSEVDQIDKPVATSKMKVDNAEPITISKTEADLIAKLVATFGTDVDENGRPAAISELGVNIEKSVSTSKTEIDIEISASTSKAEVNKNEKFTTIPKTEVDQNESSAVSSKTEVNVSVLPATDTNTKSNLNKDSSVSSKTDTNEKSEPPSKSEADKNENSAVASKTEVNASGLLATETNTKSNLNENSSMSSKTDTNEKSESPSKAEPDKRETPTQPSKAEKRSVSQKNGIPGRGYIIGTRGVARDKKTLFDCVLCFSGEEKYGVAGGILNKHIKSKEHALKVMELENLSLYKQFKDDPDAKSEDVVNAILEFEETQKKQPLLLATEANYLSQRQNLIKKIAQKKCDTKPNSTEITSVGSTANADTVSSVPSRKRSLSTEHVEAVPGKAPVALNTLSFLPSFKKNDQESLKELESDSKKTVEEILSQLLDEKQKDRHPDKIVLVMDDRDVFLCAEKLGKFVRVIRKRDLDFAKAVELVKSDFWFGKGTLFMFLGGVFSSLKIRKHSSCSKYNCEIPVYIYHIEKDTSPNIIIDEALQLHQTILDNTADDQVLFCDLVPVHVYIHNELKLKNRLCYSTHPIDFHEKVPIQFKNQYTTAVDEFNKFVGIHTEKIGFKFESLLHATFGRNVFDAKSAFPYLNKDGVSLSKVDYNRRYFSIFRKVAAVRNQLHSVASKIALLLSIQPND